jgi:hypothetical protein
MIKIRYRDSNELSPGLHAVAERHGRSTTVYLLSGLTAQERRAALRRLRLSARMGYCPRLPDGQLALALLADRIRTTIGRAGAVFRLHPAGSTVPVMVISGGAIAFLVLSTVSIRVLHAPPTASESSAAGTSPVASAAAIPITGTSHGLAAGLGGGPGQGSDNRQLTQPGSGGLGGASLARSPAQAGASGSGQGNGAGTGSGNGGGGSGGSGKAGRGTAGGTTLSGGADPTPTSAAAASTTPAAAAATAPAAATSSSAAPKPTPSARSSQGSGGSSGGVCVDVGPLGICLNV